MGEIRAIIELRNDRDIYLHQQGKLKENEIRKVTIDALVDTGIGFNN